MTGVYHKSDVKELDGVLESIVKQNLPRTYGHINSDEADDSISRSTLIRATHTLLLSTCILINLTEA